MGQGPRLAALLLVLFAISAAPAHAVYSEAARWGGAGSGDGRLNSPRGLDVHGSSGNVWVADALNNRIQQFTPDGVFVSKFGGPGSGPGQLAVPSDVAVAPDATLLVADRNNNRVQRFSIAGAFLGTIGSAGTGDGQLSHPVSVEAIGTEIFVADLDNRRVQVFGADGTFLRRSAPGRFGDVYALTRFSEVTPPIDSTGDTGLVERLAVIDGNQRVQTFTTSGTFLRAWGAPGSAERRFRFAGAADVAASPDSDGNDSDLFVSDPGNDRIQKFTSSGSFIEAIGVDELSRPRGLAVGADGSVFVTETESNRIRRYRFGPPPPEAGESGQLEVARGTVKVKRRGSSSFVELEDADTLPLGSVVDTTKGTIDLTVDAGGGTMQTAEVSKGMFKMAQTKGSRKTTELTLQGGSFKACKKAASSSHKPKSRKLFVKAKGRFRSIGRYSSATVRGTTWTMTDTCSGTLTSVSSGSVTVRDLRRKRNVTVRKGKKYLVRPR